MTDPINVDQARIAEQVAEFVRKQTELDGLLVHQLDMDVAHGRALYLAGDGEVVELALAPLASFGLHSNTLKWAWAYDEFALPDELGEATFRQLAEDTGLAHLAAAEPVPLGDDAVQPLFAVVVQHLNAVGTLSEVENHAVWTHLILRLKRDVDCHVDTEQRQAILHTLLEQSAVGLFNALRQRHPDDRPSFAGADLRGKANPWKGDLHAQVLLDMGRLRDHEPRSLEGVNLSRCRLDGVNLRGVGLRGASFRRSTLVDADLAGSDLTDAEFEGAFLNGTSFVRARMAGARLAGAEVGRTLFCDVDLADVHGLNDVRHSVNSEVSFSTLVRSAFQIEEQFLQSAGVSPGLLDDLRRGKRFATEYQTCFVSYSSKDADFARALYYALTEAGVRVWLDQSELMPGHSLAEQLRVAIEEHDRTIPILSAHSLQSVWVEREIKTALYYRPDGLAPVRLCPIEPIQAFVRERDIRPDISEGLPILDFSNWQDDATFRRKTALLLKAIRR